MISYNGRRVSEVCGAIAEQIWAEGVQPPKPDTRLLYAPSPKGEDKGAIATEESRGAHFHSPVLSMNILSAISTVLSFTSENSALAIAIGIRRA